MAKKQMSFAEKAAKHKAHHDWKTIKYVKSEKSDKTGNWRFNESFVRLSQNENLDQALTRMQKEIDEMTKEMASIEDSAQEIKVEEKTKETSVKTEEKVEKEEVKTESADKSEEEEKAEKLKAKATEEEKKSEEKTKTEESEEESAEKE
jgi:hypothetical protein